MTLKAFLAELQKVDAGWELTAEGYIMSSDESCPIAEVCLSKLGDRGGDVFESGERLGLSKPQVRQIMAAADNAAGHSVSLRKRLLKACGLTE